MKRNERRNKNYNRLREVGYSRLEATRYKDRSVKIVDALVELKTRKDHELLMELEAILSRKVLQ
jgi:hypothetical protein